MAVTGNPSPGPRARKPSATKSSTAHPTAAALQAPEPVDFVYCEDRGKYVPKEHANQGVEPGDKSKGGRPKGSRNKRLSQEEMAKKYAHKAVKELARIMQTSRSDNSRIVAAKAILDRAFGKPTQPQAPAAGQLGSKDNPLTVVHDILKAVPAPATKGIPTNEPSGDGDSTGRSGSGERALN